jgi:hypothetical protein
MPKCVPQAAESITWHPRDKRRNLAYAGRTRVPGPPRAVLFAIVSTAAVLLSAQAVEAALPPLILFSTRYASSTGSNSNLNECKDAQNPCTLDRAIESADTGDQVIVAAGEYHPSGISWFVNKRLNIHGATNGPRPQLRSTSSSAPTLELAADGTHAWHLDLENSGNLGEALLVEADGTLVEDIYAHTPSGASTCQMAASTGTLRDTVCWNSRTLGSGSALAVSDGQACADQSPAVRNVTAISDSHAPGSTGLVVLSNCDTPNSLDVTVVNSILGGGDRDVATHESGTGAIKATLSYSNYDPARVSEGSNTLITNGGHNQAAVPLFADAPNGDFHQVAGSPTIDAGSTDDAHNGTKDFELDARTLGGATDIGADEYVPPGTPPGGGGTEADTTPPAFLAAAVHRTKRGFRFDYTLSEDALVKFKIERLRRRHGHRRWVRVVTLAQRGLAGGNAEPWSARVRGHGVPRGRYRVSLTATDAAGNRSARKRLGFRVRRRR